MKEEQPLKYQEYTGGQIASKSVRDAHTRLLFGQETTEDRNTIMRGEQLFRWGIDIGDEDDQSATETSEFGTVGETEYHRRYGKMYKGFLKRVFRLQAMINSSEMGEIQYSWRDEETDEERNFVLNQSVVNTFVDMTIRMRDTLHDAGYQGIVNDIHDHLGIEAIGKNDNGAYFIQRREHREEGDGKDVIMANATTNMKTREIPIFNSRDWVTIAKSTKSDD